MISPHSVTDGHLIVQDAQKAFGGRVDVLINNAGILRTYNSPLAERNEEREGAENERADLGFILLPLPVSLVLDFLSTFPQETSRSRICQSRYVDLFLYSLYLRREADFALLMCCS